MSTEIVFTCDGCHRQLHVPDDGDAPGGWWRVSAPCGYSGDACSTKCARTIVDAHAAHATTLHVVPPIATKPS